jgi:hypothetical protein
MIRLVSLFLILAVVGCANIAPHTVPDGYDVDLTPDCEGESWR